MQLNLASMCKTLGLVCSATYTQVSPGFEHRTIMQCWFIIFKVHLLYYAKVYKGRKKKRIYGKRKRWNDGKERQIDYGTTVNGQQWYGIICLSCALPQDPGYHQLLILKAGPHWSKLCFYSLLVFGRQPHLFFKIGLYFI